MIEEDEIEDINKVPTYSDNKNSKCLCNKCIMNVIQCEVCKGLFSIDNFDMNHKNKCKQLYAKFYQKEELVECEKCNSFFELLEYETHLGKCHSELEIPCEAVACKNCYICVNLEEIEEHERNCAQNEYDSKLSEICTECDFCKEKISFAQIEDHETNCKSLQESRERLNKFLHLTNVEFPKNWDESNVDGRRIAENIILIELKKDSTEFVNVSETFKNTNSNYDTQVNAIHRVQNSDLWNKHFCEKIKIQQEKGSANELNLFYYDEIIKSDYIFKNGFDISFAVDHARYGRGIYFNRRVDSVLNKIYSKNAYAKVKYIFLANVIVGKSTYQSKDIYLRKPPFLDKSKFIYYDSVTDVNNSNSLHQDNLIDQTFVIYNNEKAYPMYFIEFDEIIPKNLPKSPVKKRNTRRKNNL
jgi:hypothetical protein